MANRWVFRRPWDYRKRRKFRPPTGGIERSLGNTVTFTQNVAFTNGLPESASSTLVLAQRLSNPFLSKLVLTQQVSLAGSKYNKSLTSTLALTSQVARYFSLTSTITFTQQAFRVYPTSSTLVLAHTVSVQHSRALTSVLELTDLATYVRVRREAFSVLNLTSFVNCDATLNRSVTTFWTTLSQKLNPGPRSDLFLRQTVVRARVRFFSASNSIVFDTSVDRSKVVFSGSTLALAHSVSVLPIRNRQLVSPLALVSTVVLGQKVTKAVLSTLLFNQVVIGTKVKHLVILQTPEDIIILPRPLLGDKESGTDVLNVKRAMNGVVRTYVKTSVTKRLSYTFKMKTDKALELREFVDKHPTDVMRMENFKGEIWQVQFTNDPFEFNYDSRRAPCKEDVLVTLEMEGTKLYG